MFFVVLNLPSGTPNMIQVCYAYMQGMYAGCSRSPVAMAAPTYGVEAGWLGPSGLGQSVLATIHWGAQSGWLGPSGLGQSVVAAISLRSTVRVAPPFGPQSIDPNLTLKSAISRGGIRNFHGIFDCA